MENKTNNKKIDQKNKEEKIVIIGAGAAGLTAAFSLRMKGYNNITLLERSSHAGGKCFTIDIDKKNYELGAGMVGDSNTMVMKLVKKYAISLQRVKFGSTVIVEGTDNIIRRKRNFKNTLILAYQIFFIYRSIQKKYKILEQPGFVGKNNDELSMSFADFAKKYKFEHLSSELELSHTGFGYGYFVDIPAAYVLKYYSWTMMMSFIKHRMYLFTEGIGRFWMKVAQDFNIKYNVEITKIIRKNNKVCISYNTNNIMSEIEYDTLIISSPLNDLHTFLDIRDTENELFTQIKNIDYRTILCSLKNFPKITGYAPYNFSSSYAGNPVFWYHRHIDTDVYTFYILGTGKNMSDSVIINNIKNFVNSMGGNVEKVHTIKHWKYFPHVSSDVFKSGFYDKLDILQGKNNTYYIGEIMNFGTVGLTSEYADYLVQKYF